MITAHTPRIHPSPSDGTTTGTTRRQWVTRRGRASPLRRSVAQAHRARAIAMFACMLMVIKPVQSTTEVMMSIMFGCQVASISSIAPPRETSPVIRLLCIYICSFAIAHSHRTMDTTGDEMIKLLLEIVMDLYWDHTRQRRYHDTMPVSDNGHLITHEQSPGDSMHARAASSVFLAIRAVQDEEAMTVSNLQDLQNYDMSKLCELLALSAIYHVKRLTAGKVGYLLTNLSLLRENVLFDVRKWMQTTLLTATIKFPGIICPRPGAMPASGERSHRPPCSCRT